MPWYKDKIFWTIFVGAAFIKTLALLCLIHAPLGEQVLVFPDSLGYVYPAQTFLTYGHFWEAVTATPLLLRTPGYPLFLALVQFLTGNMTWAVAAAQNLLSLFLLIPVYLATLHVSNRTAARYSAGFCAASVLYFSLSFAVLSEIWCLFLLAWFVQISLRWLEDRRGQNLFLAVLFLVAAVYVRPVAYYFVFVGTLLLGIMAWREKSRLILKQTVCYFVLPAVILLGAWHVRNFWTTGYSGFTTVAAYNLYIWNEDFVAREKGLTVAQAHDELINALPEDFYQRTPLQQVKTYRQLAKPLLKKSWRYKLSRVPLWAAKTLLGTNHVHTLRLILARADEPKNTLNQTEALPRPWLNSLWERMIFVLSLLQVLGVVIGGFSGLWILLKKRPQAALFLTAYVCYFWGISSTFLGTYARFRAPFEFVLCITAGIAIATWTENRSHPKNA